jgi:hypothetical protein
VRRTSSGGPAAAAAAASASRASFCWSRPSVSASLALACDADASAGFSPSIAVLNKASRRRSSSSPVRHASSAASRCARAASASSRLRHADAVSGERGAGGENRPWPDDDGGDGELASWSPSLLSDGADRVGVGFHGRCGRLPPPRSTAQPPT